MAAKKKSSINSGISPTECKKIIDAICSLDKEKIEQKLPAIASKEEIEMIDAIREVTRSVDAQYLRIKDCQHAEFVFLQSIERAAKKYAKALSV